MGKRFLTSAVATVAGLTGLGLANPIDADLTGQVDLDGPIREIRIRVFPHAGKYVTPHGRDTAVDRVKIKAAKPSADCQVFSSPETLPSDVVTSGPELTFHARTLQKGQWVRCDGPATLVREPGLPERSYAGLLWIQSIVGPGSRPELQVVENIAFEDYVAGVVPAEVPPSWSMEALAAQAIAARSYAYFQVLQARESRAHPDYDVDDTVTNQAYLGYSGRSPTTDLAVTQTHGQVLVHDSEVIKAYFHADSGGHTENAVDIFGGKPGEFPYCRAQPEPYEPSMHDGRWSQEFNIPRLGAQFVAQKILAPGETLTDVLVDPEAFPSGRARYVVLHLAGGKRKRLRADNFRFATGLRSSWFEVIRTSTDTIRLDGRGHGHGVGMSQWGAQVLARDLNWDHQRILAFYYAGAQLHSTNVSP